MKIVTVKYDGVPVPANMPDDLCAVLEHIATVKRGRFGHVAGHQSGVGDPKCNRPTVSDITFLTQPRYDRWLERMHEAVKAIEFVTFIGKVPNLKEMEAKSKGVALESIFDTAKAEILDSLQTSQDGDGTDGHRMGHRLCYATYDAGDVAVKCHLKTERGDDKLMRPVLTENGLMEVGSIMLPFFVVSRKVTDPGDWKETDSRVLTLMKDAIKRATGQPQWKALSLGKGNFKTLTMDKATVFGLVAEPLKATITVPQASYFSYIAGVVEGFWTALENMKETVVAYSHQQ